jgi:hypothetical protein
MKGALYQLSWMCSNCNLIKKKNTNLSWMNKICIIETSNSQNVLYEDNLYNITRNTYKTICAELSFKSLSIEWRWFFFM